MGRGTLDFLSTLDKEVLLCDGAKSTIWYEQGLNPASYAEQNLSNPDNVIKLHLEYIAAGARIIETNTFRANRLQLAKYALESQVQEINAAAVRLAEQAIKLSGRDDIFIAGSVGPLGALVKPYGNLTLKELGEIYQEQIEVLYEAGVDLLLIETHPSLLEALEAVRAARTLDTRPIIAQMTFLEDGLTKFGDELRRSLETLAAADADVVGVNCTLGPRQMYDRLADFLKSTKLRVCVQPNAGLPQIVGERQLFLTSPDYLQEYARLFIEAGANIIGGCCGTTPEHIRAMAKVVTGQTPRRRRAQVIVTRSETTTSAVSQPKLRNVLADKLGREFVTTVEINAPLGLNYRPSIEQVQQLMNLGVDAIQVTDNPMARVRMSSIAFAHLVQVETAMEAVLHFTCRDRNLLGIQSELMGAAALGIRWILALTGDPSSVGELPTATSVFDVNSAGLVRILHGLNQGFTLAGTDITIPTNFRIGASVNPAAPNLDLELAKLQEKIDSGVDFAQTQPVFDIELLEHFAEKVKHLNIPILIGLLPLRSARQAEFLHNEVPGTRIPEWIRNRLSEGDLENAMEEGVKISAELMANIKRLFPGVHIRGGEDFVMVERLLAKHRAAQSVS
ncbi:MAG: bifunctional homocysteine S-methyltransferase/methylenetetrahydrofolate reductase [Acidobacteriota bacterium]